MATATVSTVAKEIGPLPQRHSIFHFLLPVAGSVVKGGVQLEGGREGVVCGDEDSDAAGAAGPGLVVVEVPVACQTVGNDSTGKDGGSVGAPSVDPGALQEDGGSPERSGGNDRPEEMGLTWPRADSVLGAPPKPPAVTATTIPTATVETTPAVARKADRQPRIRGRANSPGGGVSTDSVITGVAPVKTVAAAAARFGQPAAAEVELSARTP